MYKLIGAGLPWDISQRKNVQSSGYSLGAFFTAPITYTNKSGGDLLIRRVRKQDVSNGVVHVFQPYDAGKPGFSNKPLAQPEQCTPNEVQAAMAWKSFVAAVVTEKQAEEQEYKHIIFNRVVPHNVVASCEDQLINGTGSEITGLLHTGDEDCLTRNEEPIDFLHRALKEYASRAGRMPTHIVLPYTEILALLASGQRMANAARGFRNKSFEVFGVPVIESTAIPENRGLIVAADEITLATSPGMEWEFGHRNKELKSCGLSAIILKCQLGLLIKRQEAVVRLNFDGTPLPSPSLLKALAKPESES